MRLKYYLRGLGIGVTLATLLLTISFYFGKDALAKRELTDAEIIERATELGMVMKEDAKEKDKTDKKSEDPKKDESKADDNIEETDKADSTEKSDDPNKEMTLEEAIESETNASDVDKSEASESTVTYVPFTIKAGASSETVATELHKAGLIDSSAGFSEYMNKLGVDDRIQAGTFYVKQDSSYDDIIALLVNKEARTTTPPKEE
ncbi:MAG: endolytic transglycosylase MltG [Pseudobutyrivibrio sp.]|nr:endolytic transglycosylase MltG [Pseudobutyrivibrio sp.]